MLQLSLQTQRLAFLDDGRRVHIIWNLTTTAARGSVKNTSIPYVGLSSLQRKRKRSDSVLWQKPLHPQNNPKSNVTTQKRHQKLWLHNYCGPT